LSRESQSSGADAVSSAEGNTFRTHHRKVRTAQRGRRTERQAKKEMVEANCVEKDGSQALDWYQKAAAQGNQDARNRIDEAASIIQLCRSTVPRIQDELMIISKTTCDGARYNAVSRSSRTAS
jgi:TPR repeat protein